MWLSCRSFRIIAVLVISAKQPSSGLLQLCGLHLCVLAKLSATVVLFNMFFASRKHFVFQAILSHRAITSTNVDGTAFRTTVPGYHTLSMTERLLHYVDDRPAVGSLTTSPDLDDATMVTRTSIPHFVDLVIDHDIFELVRITHSASGKQLWPPRSAGF